MQTAIRHHQAGQLPQAEVLYRQVLQAEPSNADALHLLGLIAYQSGGNGAAVELIGRAVALNGKVPDYHNNLGLALHALGRLEEAVASYREALALNPRFAEAYNNLGTTLQQQDHLDEAITNYRHAVELKPDYVHARSNLAGALMTYGLAGEAIEEFREAIAVGSRYPEAHGNFLMCLNYDPACSPETMRREALHWAALYAPVELAMAPIANVVDPERGLRVGYVSADFRSHPIGYFIEAVLAGHDKSWVEVFCYANQRENDDLTERLRRNADHLRDIAGLSDEAVAALIRRDGIDILIDLSGHTCGNRLLVFARKPAPIQATWIGYFATTGLRAMDYIIGDRFVLPPGEERHYVEKPLRLPDGYLCFTPPALPVDVAPLPALAAGRLTFGSFNNISKINAAVVALWARILHSVPNSRLLLKTQTLGSPVMRERCLAQFAEHGVAEAQLAFAGFSPRAEGLAAYNEVDIGLDPFPYNGGTTTADALWMGVPVITLKGDRFAGHIAESVLTSAGLPDWVAASPEEYVEMAIQWASDLPRLAALRAGLRQQTVASPLCDGARFTRKLELAYRDIWRTWCRHQTRDRTSS